MVIRAGVVALALAIGACGGTTHALPSGTAVATDEVTLYRDRALVKHRIDVVVPEASHATVSYVVPEGVSIDDVAVVDRGVVTISELRSPVVEEPEPEPLPDELDGERDLEEDLERAEAPRPAPPETPTTVTFDVTAPKAGRYSIAIAYVTDRITWNAAYTMTTTPRRERASLRGAIAIRSRLAAPLPAARTQVVDAELGAWRGQIAEQVGGALTGDAAGSTTLAATPRVIGDLVIAKGETRVELLPDEAPRPMRSVLVYDPIGTRLDNSSARPILDATLGMEKASTRVTESFEVVRPRASSEGLPAGPVGLLERRADGALVVLGESRLFDAATRVATVDTIALGTAEGVTGSRERRELSYDEDGRRLVEEFVISIKNTRAHPVEVVLREHLYRGQNWTLAYQTASEPTKEGPQQISLRTIAPARGEAKVLYVVVYTGL
ncbi:MAG: hypothetical protein AB7T06_03735 [Kofleriaceae bacterium]